MAEVFRQKLSLRTPPGDHVELTKDDLKQGHFWRCSKKLARACSI